MGERGFRDIRMLGRTICERSWCSEEKGAESDVRKRSQRWWEAGRGGAQTSPILCFLFPLLRFLVAYGNTRHVHGKAGEGSEYGLSDLRVRRDEYLPVLGDEEFNPPWRL